jgi:serine/threonine protein kinase
VLNSDALASQKAVERFLREARVVAQMHHNHIVPVFDFGRQGGAPFIVSKFIPGQVLAQAVPEEGMDPARAVALVIQLLEALAYAHAGVKHEDREVVVLHRDVKPSNAVLDTGGQLYLMDFGLAGWLGQETGRMTHDGAVMGTPAYMAPEQAKGDIRRVGPAADQYSAGVVLYELLTGHTPFEGPVQVLIFNAINTPPSPPSEWRPDLDPRLEEICLKALAKKPEERYASCRDFADALRAWCAESGEPIGVEEVKDEEPPPKRDPEPKTTPPRAKDTVKIAPQKRPIVEPPRKQREPVAAPAGGRSGRAWLLVVGGAVAVLILVAVAFVAFRWGPTTLKGGQGETRPAPTTRSGIR